MVSLTACVLLLKVCECLRLSPCAAAARRAMDGMVRLRSVPHAACWVVRWLLLLLLLQVALVGARGREQQQAGQQAGRKGEAGEQREAGQQGPQAERRRQEVAQGEPMPSVPGAWRRQLLNQVDAVGTLCGVVRLLVAYPRVHLGPGPGDKGQLLRALLPPGVTGGLPGRGGGGLPAGGAHGLLRPGTGSRPVTGPGRPRGRWRHRPGAGSKALGASAAGQGWHAGAGRRGVGGQ